MPIRLPYVMNNSQLLNNRDRKFIEKIRKKKTQKFNKTQKLKQNNT